MFCYKFDIEVHPLPPEDEPEKPTEKASKAKVWHWPWRINQLAIPRRPVSKYVPPPAITPSKIFGPINPNAAFRCDHLARPGLRILHVNKNMYSSRGAKYVKTIDKTIQKTWDSIYNYYKKKLREIKRKEQRRLQAKLKLSKKEDPKKKQQALDEERQKLVDRLAIPKKVFLPEKIVRKWVPLEDIAANIDRLATPKEYVIIPPRPLGVVSEAALQYEITENVMRLYTSAPERLKKRMSEPRMPGAVSRAALRATCTPRIDKLAQPSVSAREAKKKEEDMYDPWEIPKNALKYKPTQRILELAKPLERE